MKWIFALTALLAVVLIASAQSCPDVSTKLQQMDSKLELLKTINENQQMAYSQKFDKLDASIQKSKTDLIDNDDSNSQTLETRIISTVIDRTDPVKTVVPFLMGFLFCFALCSAIVIRFNWFDLRKLLDLDGHDQYVDEEIYKLKKELHQLKR